MAAGVLNFPALLKLAIKVAYAQPHIVHVNNGKEGLLLSRLLKVPLVRHLHGISSGLGTSAYQGKAGAAAVIGISQHIAKEAAKRGIEAGRITVVPNPAPVAFTPSRSREEWAQQYGLRPDAVVLAHVGRLVRWKGQREFLEAFARIAPDYPNAVALIVGDDVEGFTSLYPTELREFVTRQGLVDRVVFTGHISNIMEVMAFSHIVVHSSIEPEPFGLVIIEAMSAGAAVVAARLGAPVEIVEHGVTGLLVNPTDAVEFGDALARLVRDKSWREQLASAGRKVARKTYSPELFATRVEAVYDGILEGSARHG